MKLGEKIVLYASLFSLLVTAVYFVVSVNTYKEKVDALEEAMDKESDLNIELWREQYEVNGAMKEHMKHDK